jgi:hyaluronoglucosaminidase
MDVELGIVEGFYGKPWSWNAREAAVRYLAPHGYRFYMYAPKADPFLRRRWKEPYPETLAEPLGALSALCAEAGVRFGVGLSPYGIHGSFDEEARSALDRKLALFDGIGVRDLGVLFDDMRGDVEDLAERQAAIVGRATERTGADRVIVCPSYYSDDPVLDRAFGRRPERYLEQLGRLLDPSIEIFWTGEEVCSRELSPAHLERVAEQMGRSPFIWDNYPVNDGQRMSQFLHLRGFTGRPASLAGVVSAHGINPALQPTLSLIPSLTLAESYRLGTGYSYGEAFERAAVTVLGPDLGRMVREDLLILQDVGLDRLGEKEERLRERYAGIDHPGALEIIGWLDGEYRITDEIVLTQ